VRPSLPSPVSARALLSPIAAPEASCHRLLPVRSEAHPAVRHLEADSPELEAIRIFGDIRTLLALGIRPTEIAVLVRVRTQIPRLREEATRWGIPFYTPPLRKPLESPAETPPPPGDAVTVLTMHQAKGSEWTVVFIAGCQVGLLPHASAKTLQARHEERRLLYVAVTRAKQLVWFCRNGQPSPFLAPLTGCCHGAARPSSSPPRWWGRLLSAVRARGRQHREGHQPGSSSS